MHEYVCLCSLLYPWGRKEQYTYTCIQKMLKNLCWKSKGSINFIMESLKWSNGGKLSDLKTKLYYFQER